MRGGLLPTVFSSLPLSLLTPPSIRMMATTVDFNREKRLLRGVLSEALEAQDRKRFALEQQAESAQSLDIDADDKARAKALRRAAAIPIQLLEVDKAEERLRNLKASLSLRRADLSNIRQLMEEECGLGKRLTTFDIDANALNQYGRPDGFDGLVIESPRGIPILVARKAFSDALLRRVGRGTDLWYQVREGKGSRVLLRTSLCRNLSRSPRQCHEMAADLAAYFSTARHFEAPEVIYTDSRHVAKRGARVGQMKDNKRLGALTAQPERVASIAREAQEEQGWL